jgi:hypothetical protein
MTHFANGDAESRVNARYEDFSAEEMQRVQREHNAELAAREVARLSGSVPAAQAPVNTTPVREVVRRASEASIAFLVRLTAERNPGVTAETAEAIVRDYAELTGQRGVSKRIDELKATPRPARTVPVAEEAPAVPAGRYAVTGEEGHTVFVKVDRPTEGRWAGYVFVKVQAGDDEHRVSRATEAALLAKIEAVGPQAAMIRYGLELGHCGHCGRTLTNEASREAGIGPICLAKMGW